MSDERSDEALMAAYIDGDARALRELFRRHAPRLLRSMTLHTGSHGDAQDIVQATFLNLHRARRDFRAGSRVRPWLYAIAFNLMRDHHRSRGRRREELAEPDSQAAHPDHAPGPDARLLDEPIHRALTRLPEQQREVIVLHWFEGLSFAEIADTVGAGHSAVKVRAHRGYKRLREMLEADGLASQSPKDPGDLAVTVRGPET